MDYTLALYKSPEFEELTFQQVLESLIELGYPEQIREFVYDRSFPLRSVQINEHRSSLELLLFSFSLVEVFGTINCMAIYLKWMLTAIFSLSYMDSSFCQGTWLLSRRPAISVKATSGVCLLFRHEVRQLYPNKYIMVDDRIYVFYTLFNLPGKGRATRKVVHLAPFVLQKSISSPVWSIISPPWRLI